MKKLTIITVILAAVSVAAFTQQNGPQTSAPPTSYPGAAQTSSGNGPQLSGYVYSDIEIYYNQNGNLTWGPNWWTDQYNYGGQSTTYGIDLTSGDKGIHFSQGWDGIDYFISGNGAHWPTLNHFYLSYTPFPDELTFEIGYVDDGTFQKKDPYHGNGYGYFQDWGVYARWSPPDTNFSVGTLIPAKFVRGDSVGVPLTDALKSIDVAASYTIPDIVKFAAGTEGDFAATGSGNQLTSKVYDLTLRQIFGWAELNVIQAISGTVFYVGYTQSNQAFTGRIFGTYTYQNLAVAYEGEFAPTNFGTTVQAGTWLVQVNPSYTIAGILKPGIIGTVQGSLASGDSTISYTINPYVTFPTFGYVTVGFSYNGSTSTATAATWQISLSMDYWIGF